MRPSAVRPLCGVRRQGDRLLPYARGDAGGWKAETVKTTVRWRFLSDAVDWSLWTVNGRRIIVDDPKKARKGKKENFEDRVLKVLKHPINP